MSMAAQKEVVMVVDGYLDNPEIARIFFGVLVQRLGGTVTITQEDIDKMLYYVLDEESDEDGVKYTLEKPNEQN